MRWMFVLCALLAASLAGCAATPGPDAEVAGTPSGATLGNDEFWLVLVSGDEAQRPFPSRMCSVLWTHTVDDAAQTIRYSSDPLAGNQVGDAPRSLISAVVWDPSGCPIINQVTDAGRVDVPLNALGTVTVTALQDGRVLVGDEVLQPGQSITLSHQVAGQDADGQAVSFTDELVVRAAGPWPRSSLMMES